MSAHAETVRKRRAPWFVWLFCLAAVAAVWLAVVVAGREEVLGNVAFGLLVTAILVNASVVTSYFLDAKYQAASQVVWLLVAVGCLALALVVSSKDHPDALKDASIVLTYVMLALSFPASLIVGLLAAVLTPILSPSVDGPHGLIYLILLWAALFVAGYLQWFKLAPSMASGKRGQYP